MKPGILGIGIATMDIYLYHGKMYPGGNEVNVAYHAARQGARAGFMGVFADDRVGIILEKTLNDAGVDTSHSHHEHGSSGYALIDLKDGDRVFIDWNRNGVTDLYPFDFTEEEIEYIRSFDVACISRGGRVSDDKVIRLAEAGASVCYDFYDTFTDTEIETLSPFIRYAFFSCSHISSEETVAVLKKCTGLGCSIAVGTRGKDLALCSDGTHIYEIPARAVKAVDTMGAGDSYISSFLTNYLSSDADESSDENKIKRALRAAADYAAWVVTIDGALGIGYDVDPARLPEILNI